jgi:hypothetical protein
VSARKPSDRRQGHRRHDPDSAPKSPPVQLPWGVVAGEPRPAPPADRRWLRKTAAAWSVLWSSDLAGHITAADEPVVHRCFDWRDEQARWRAEADRLDGEAAEKPELEGSRGEPTPNPLFERARTLRQRASALEPRIAALEDRLGLTPAALMALGAQAAQRPNPEVRNATIAATWPVKSLIEAR